MVEGKITYDDEVVKNSNFLNVSSKIWIGIGIIIILIAGFFAWQYWVVPPKILFRTIDTNLSHTLAIKTDGTLWAWGENTDGQLGLGDTIKRYLPTQVGTDTNWEQITTGWGHTLAIKTDGTLWAWGENTDGQLGLGDTIERYSPTQVGTDTTWRQVIAGEFHTLAIKTDDTLWAWGRNRSGQLGLGNTNRRFFPDQVGIDNNWKQVTAGNGHTLAIKTNGTLWAWGMNSVGIQDSGQLGLGDTIKRYSPTQVGTDTTWKQVTAGEFHTLAIKTDGTLWAWGMNTDSQLGLGDIINRLLPVQIGADNDWKQIAAGSGHTLAIKTDGTLWAWGNNDSGQLGLGDIGIRDPLLPVQVGTNANWRKVVAGVSHTLAIKINSTLWGWGGNWGSQLGLIDLTNHYSPVQVDF